MQLLVVLYNLCDEVSIGVKDGNTEPHPLGRPKEWNRIFNGMKVCMVSDLDEFSKEEHLTQGDYQTNIQMTQIYANDKDCNQCRTRDDADHKFLESGFILGNFGAGHGQARARTGRA